MAGVRPDGVRATELPIGVYPNGCVASTPDHEDTVLREFCKALNRKEPFDLKFVDRKSRPLHGLAQSADASDSIDGLLLSPRGPIAVEILDYSPPCDRGEVIKHDVWLTSDLLAGAGETLRRLNADLHLTYRDEIRKHVKEGQDPFVKAVPGGHQRRQAVVHEIAEVLDR